MRSSPAAGPRQRLFTATFSRCGTAPAQGRCRRGPTPAIEGASSRERQRPAGTGGAPLQAQPPRQRNSSHPPVHSSVAATASLLRVATAARHPAPITAFSLISGFLLRHQEADELGSDVPSSHTPPSACILGLQILPPTRNTCSYRRRCQRKRGTSLSKERMTWPAVLQTTLGLHEPEPGAVDGPAPR